MNLKVFGVIVLNVEMKLKVAKNVIRVGEQYIVKNVILQEKKMDTIIVPVRLNIIKLILLFVDLMMIDISVLNGMVIKVVLSVNQVFKMLLH